MTRVRAAVIGAGIWGRTNIRAYVEHPSADLVAICDSDKERARRVSEEFGVRRYYASVERMLREEELDAVSVVTPDAAHASIAIACAKAGKHVLCEKPLATTIEECEAMIAAARENNVYLMVDWHNRWNPPFYAAWKAIREGEIGDVRYIYYRLNDTIYVPTKMLPWAGESSVMLFLGSHSLDTTCWFLDRKVERVTCRRQEGILSGKGIPTADMYVTILDFEGGGMAVIENNWVLPQSSPSLIDHQVEIVGTDGAIYLNPQSCGAIAKYTKQTPEGFPNASLPDMFVMPEVQGRQAGFAVKSIHHFVECVRDGKPPITSGRDGLLNTRLILAAEESASGGGVPVRVAGQ
jgi:predicted dehydrogenase